MTLEVSKELGESIMSNIVRENNGYVYLSKLLQAVYLDDKPYMALNLNEIVYIQ